MRSGVKLVFIFLLIVALFVPLYLLDVERHTSSIWKNHGFASEDPRFTDLKDNEGSSSNLNNLANKTPKITIIVIWMTRSDQEPHYMSWFWQGVRNNPDINLLFVNVDIAGNGCKKYSNLPNVKEICLSQQEYYQLHIEYLCKDWLCTNIDKEWLLRHMVEDGKRDKNHSFFRILRNGVFSRWIDPDTTIWGWCDVDVFWGNFGRMFPWDIAHDFDVLAIASLPDFREKRLLFTRGHMALFRNTPETSAKLRAYPVFTSLAAFLLSPPIHRDAEESEFSNYYFGKNTDFTFIILEGMIDSYDTVLVSPQGTWYTEVAKEKFTAKTRQELLLNMYMSIRDNHQPTFTDEGVETEIAVHVGEGFNGFVWFPEHLAVWVNVNYTGTKAVSKRTIFLRRTPGGPVTQRLESRDRYIKTIEGKRVEEGLYKHFQAEKYRKWFFKLPSTGLEPGQTLAEYKIEEGELWDEEGVVLFKTGKDPVTESE